LKWQTIQQSIKTAIVKEVMIFQSSETECTDDLHLSSQLEAANGNMPGKSNYLRKAI